MAFAAISFEFRLHTRCRITEPAAYYGMLARAIAKELGSRTHAIVSRSGLLARPYLALLGSVCRALPDGAWKQFVANSVQSVEWPEVRLHAVKTKFPSGDARVDPEVTLIPHPGEFDFAAHLYRRLPYESEVFHWLAGRSYNTVLEIGANVGAFSLYFAKRFPQGSVYAFEPSRKAFARLLANVAVNRCPNLFVFNCAIFSESGLLEFYEPEGHLTNGSLDASFASSFSQRIVSTPIPAIAADRLELFFQSPPVLIKVDVEGAEPHVLASLTPLIERYRPDLIIEVLPVTAAALNKLSFLRNGGYQLFNIRPEGLVAKNEFAASEWRDYALLPVVK